MCRLLSIILTILLFILSGCSGAPDSRLLTAETSIDTNPDSVLALLSAIDTTRLSSRNRALCNLLYTQALDKTDAIAADSDPSRISSALRYFSRHGSDREKMLSNFYRARYFFYGGEYEEAMQYAFFAYRLSEKVGEPYWIAKSAEFVADINSATFLSDEFLKYEKIAVDNYRLDNSRGNYEYALCDYAYEKIYRGELEEGISICDSVFKVAVASGNHFLAINAAENLLDGYHRAANSEAGLRVLQYLNSRPEYIPASYNLSLAAGLFRMNHMPDSALYYLEASRERLQTDREKTTLFDEYRRLYLVVGDTVKAYAMLDSLFIRQNEYIHGLMSQPAMRAQKDYFSNEADRQGKMVVSRNLTILTLSILFLLIIAISVLYFRQRVKVMNLEKEGLLKDIAGLNSSIVDLNQDIDSRNHTIDTMSDEIHSLHHNISELEGIFYSQFRTISLLANEYYERGDLVSARGEIMKRIEEEIRKWQSSEKLDEIERALNLYSDNVVKRLREQCSRLTEKNITFILYLWIGLPVKAVALFCNLKIGSFYANRQRIVEKIQNSSAPDKEEFIRRTLSSD